jgi:hypothetical protein
MKLRRTAEEASANDPVMRVVRLEEERLARTHRVEPAGAAGLPKVHLLQRRTSAEEAIPLPVRHANVGTHEANCASIRRS